MFLREILSRTFGRDIADVIMSFLPTEKKVHPTNWCKYYQAREDWYGPDYSDLYYVRHGSSTRFYLSQVFTDKEHFFPTLYANSPSELQDIFNEIRMKL